MEAVRYPAQSPAIGFFVLWDVPNCLGVGTIVPRYVARDARTRDFAKSAVPMRSRGLCPIG